jgi:hypothetical protein
MQIQLAWLSFRVIIDAVLILELENAARHLRSVFVFLEAVPSFHRGSLQELLDRRFPPAGIATWT